MRLFIAAEVPGDIRKDISGLMDMPEGAAKVKWVEEENIHLTLKFLGDIDESKAETIRNALEGVAFRKFSLKVKGFGAFPDEDYIKVLWAGLEPHEEVNALQMEIDKAMEPVGFKRGSKFHPHVTIGRVRFVKDKVLMKKWLSNLKESGYEKEFSVESFVLKRSRLGPGGPVHEEIGSFRL